MSKVVKASAASKQKAIAVVSPPTPVRKRAGPSSTPTSVKASAASSSSGNEEEGDEEQEEVPEFSHAFIKWDFCSDKEAVTVLVRVITKMVDEDEEVEEEDCFTYYRKDKSVEDEALANIFELILDTEVGMPESYLVYVKDIINALLQDSTCYDRDDIRLLWDINPDGEEPAVEPRELSGNTKIAVNAMVALDGMSYR